MFSKRKNGVIDQLEAELSAQIRREKLREQLVTPRRRSLMRSTLGARARWN
jgi:hypothetical protein